MIVLELHHPNYCQSHLDVNDEGDNALARSLPLRELPNTVSSKKSSSMSEGAALFAGRFTLDFLPSSLIAQGSWRRGGIVSMPRCYRAVER